MKYIPRLIEAELKKASRNFSAVILTGPRRDTHFRQCGAH